MKKTLGIYNSALLACSALMLAACQPASDKRTTATDGHVQKNLSSTRFLSDAGWCWFQDPRAVIHNEQLIVGGISGTNGDIRIGVYDLKEKRLLGQRVLDAGFERDDHNAPVFYLRPDGRLLAMWAEHGKESRHYYRLSEVNDFLSWGERQILQHSYEKPADRYWGGVTYMNLFTTNHGAKLYNFFRVGMDLNPYYVESSDHGDTWAPMQHFLKDDIEGTHRPYNRYLQIDASHIGVAFTDAHPRQYGNSIYYAEFDGEFFYGANSELVHDIKDGPLSTNQADKIYSGSETFAKPEGYSSVPNSAWTIDLERDTNLHPHLAYSVYLNNDDNRFRRAYWDGQAWQDREIAYAGPGLYELEASYTGLMALDPSEPEKMTISTSVDPHTGIATSGKHELYYASVPNKDAPIEWQALTQNSRYSNIRPTIVEGDGYKVLLWMAGEFHHFEDYSTDIVGLILKEPK
ncbi:BNR-4 repeat-containing protein [Agaribacterium sp. ZY112]|uniref:BNR-4 repeat-containing protein n=1 Tax=Agaribacterium sp. ZY112 TaxID=3233574 RepID=UPI0035257BC9